LNREEGLESAYQQEFRNIEGFAAVHKDVEIMNESSFINYQEINNTNPDLSARGNRPEQLLKLDSTVRNNLKKYEFDF